MRRSFGVGTLPLVLLLVVGCDFFSTPPTPAPVQQLPALVATRSPGPVQPSTVASTTGLAANTDGEPRGTAVPIPASCEPTFPDPRGPVPPDPPVRSVVGHGHVLTGTVRSSRDCLPIPGARIELQPAGTDDEHHYDQSATLITDERGTYRYESNPVEHIHMRVSAPGYRSIYTNRYHAQNGQTQGTFDIVLVPQP
jgi:protocatechuate 3,4-dioxygenase beta subunit